MSLPFEAREYIIEPMGSSSENLSPISQESDSLLIQTDSGTKYVLRREKSIEKIQAILAEYDAIGFTTRYGGELKHRSLDDQERFIGECIKNGLPVTPIALKTGGGLAFPLVEGASYSKFLSSETSPERLDRVIRTYIEDILKAHSKSIVYGDRWGPNTIVTADDKIQQIDLDLELQGEYAKEFELSQSIYYTIFFAKTPERREIAIEILNDVLRHPQQNPLYDGTVFIDLLKSHMILFQGTEYECPEIARLLQRLGAS